MNIPFIDFSEQYRLTKDEIHEGLEKVFQKGDYILGQAAKDFETNFANYCGVKYGIGVNSGTDALYLAIAALDIKEGDEVILPTFTFIATALCVSYAGATPVFVDVENDTYNIDPKAFERAVTKRTKAVIPVHLYGQSADMDEILTIARKHGIKVIEDSAQAHGATYKGKRIGSMGDVACFSFYPTKSLGAFGDAGMIVTSDPDINQKAFMLRDYGRQGRYEHKIKGYNSRLDTVQAVVLAAKLKHLDKWNVMRAEKAAYYNQVLKGVSGIVTPKLKSDRTHVYQTYAVRVNPSRRDAIMESLKAKGISSLIHYPIPLHLQEAYKELNGKRGDFPVAEALADEVLSLPMFPHITNQQIDTVCQALKESV